MNQILNHLFIPFQAVYLEFCSVDQHCNIPSICIHNRHIVITLNLIGKRNFIIFPFISRKWTCCLTFQSGILTDNHTIYICEHKWILFITEHCIGSPHFLSCCFHKPSRNIFFQIPTFSHRFVIKFFNFIRSFIIIHLYRCTIWIQTTDCPCV